MMNNKMSKEAVTFRGQILNYCMEQGLTKAEIVEKLQNKETLAKVNALCEIAVKLMAGNKEMGNQFKQAMMAALAK